MMNNVSFRGTESIQQPPEKQAQKTTKSTAKKAAVIVGTVLAGAAACAGIIYAVKSGKKIKGLQQENQQLTRKIELTAKCRAKKPALAKNIDANRAVSAARKAHVNTPNVTVANRGSEAVKEFKTAQNSETLEKLMNNVKKADKEKNSKALDDMLKQYKKLTGNEFATTDSMVINAYKNQKAAINVLESRDIRAAKEGYAEAANITPANRGKLMAKFEKSSKDTIKLWKLRTHVADAYSAGNTKALTGMLNEYNKYTGSSYTMEEMLADLIKIKK